MNSLISLSLFVLLLGLSIGCGNKNMTTSDEKGIAPTNTDKKTPASDNKGTVDKVIPPVVKAETPEEALKALAGNWRVVSIKNTPPGINADYLEKVTGEINGKVLVLSSGIGFLDRGEIRLDPTKSPKQFDLISLDKEGKPRVSKFFTTGGPNAGKQQESPIPPLLGIYNLQGDQLTLALTDRVGYRPTEFKTSTAKNTGTMVSRNERLQTYVILVELTRTKSINPK